MLVYSAVKLAIVRKPNEAQAIEAAVGTGFFWSVGGLFYLITNWHNVTAWDPIQNKSLSDTGVQPTHIRMPILLKAGDVNGQTMAQRKRFDIPLYDEAGNPIWFEHPVLGNRVDVVAIQIAELDTTVVSLPINEIDDFVDFEPAIGDDVFVLGFPKGLDGGHELAIWKRGSIASQPNFDIDNLPKLLIDTTTRNGMSGAPVIARQSGLIVPRGIDREPGRLTGQEIIGRAITFVGIYSGRLGDDPLGVQLGIVWKARVLDEIIKGGKRGSSPF